MPPIALLCLISLCVSPQESGLPYAQVALTTLSQPADSGSAPANELSTAILPLSVEPNQSTGIDWTAVSRSALRFFATMHAFRLATEADTRAGGFALASG